MKCQVDAIVSLLQRLAPIRIRIGLLIIILLLGMKPNSAFAWSIAKQIVNTPAHSTSPSTVIDSAGNTHVVWLENVNGQESEDIFYVSGNQSTWSSPINLSQSESRSLNVQLAILPDDSLLAVWVEMETFLGVPLGSQLYYAYFSHGEWSQPSLLPSLTDAVGPPTLANKNGKVYAAWSAGDLLSGYADHIELAVWDSTNWTNAEQLPINTGYLDMVDIAFDGNGQLHLVWNGNQTLDPSNLFAYQIYYTTQKNGVWSSPVNISNTTTYSFYPALACDTAGVVHVLWMEELKTETQGTHIFDRILYNRLDSKGWLATPIQLSTHSGAFFPNIAVDPLGYVHMIWAGSILDSPSDYLFRLYYTRWDGKTLSEPIQVADAPTNNAGQSMGDFAVNAADKVNPQQLRLVWSGGDSGGIAQIYYSDHLSSQVSLNDITTGNNSADHSNLVGLSANQLYLVWKQGSAPSRIVYSFWDGQLWRNPLPISPSELDSNAPASAICPDGVLHVVWHGHNTVTLTDDQTYYSRLESTGWLTPTVISDNVALAGTPDISCDSLGNLHVVWQMVAPNEPAKFAVYYRRMDHQGAQWGNIERVSPPSHNTNRPQVAADLLGIPHVVWYDLGEEEVYYASRQNHGWSTPENVSQTPRSFISNLIISQGPTIALDLTNQPHVAWVDSASKTAVDSVYYATRSPSGWISQTVTSLPDQNHSMQLASGVNPKLLSGKDGNLHLLWHDLDEASTLKIFTSNTLNQQTGKWSSPTIITPDELNAFHASGYLDAAEHLHVSWSSGEGSNQIYYQTIDRFDWLKVVDEVGRAMPNAQVYRNGQLAGKSNAHGLLFLDGLNPQDELVALAPVAEYRGEREGHDSPDSPNQNWAYRISLTNWHSDSNGNRIGDAALATPGEQLLTVRRQAPLILLNLIVSLEWAASESEIQTFRAALASASTYLFDVTNGQIALGNVAIYTSGQYWADADIQVRAFNDIRPNAGINGMRTLATTPVRIGRSWSGESGISSTNGAWNLPNGYRTLVHELGHYALGLWDSYFLETRDENGNLKDQVEAFCTSKAIRSNTTEQTNATIMDYQYNASELAMRGTASWSVDCEKTQQFAQNNESDWETIQQLFEDRTIPNLQLLSPYADLQWNLQTPLNSGILAGPSFFPLQNIPAIQTIAPLTTTATPLQLIGPSAAIQFALTTLYVQQTGGAVAIDQGYTNQQGRITILGAKDGDRIRVLARDTTYHGELTLHAGITNTLSLTPTNLAVNQFFVQPEGAPVADNATTLRFLRILPKADNRSLDIFLVGVDVGASLVGEMSLTGSQIVASIPLGYNSIIHEFHGVLVPTLEPSAQFVEGLGNVRVLGEDVNGAPFYLASGITLLPLRSNSAQMVVSADGALRLLLAKDAISPDSSTTHLLIAEHNSLSTNEDPTLHSSIYQIRLSGALGKFETPILVTLHYGITQTQVITPTLAYFDETERSWQSLPTSWDAENKIASTASTKLGYYTLFLKPETVVPPTDTPVPTITPTVTNTPTSMPTPAPSITVQPPTPTVSPPLHSIYMPLVLKE